MRYLLDTNIVSDLVRNPHGTVARQVRRVGEKHVCTSIIVAAELRYGSPRLSSQLDAVLGVLEVLPFEAPADASYGLLRTRLEKRGTPIGANDLLINDLLIAAQALTLGCVMVTDNEREFSRVEGLRLQNWLRST